MNQMTNISTYDILHMTFRSKETRSVRMRMIATFLFALLALVSGGSERIRLRDVEVRTKSKDFQVLISIHIAGADSL